MSLRSTTTHKRSCFAFTSGCPESFSTRFMGFHFRHCLAWVIDQVLVAIVVLVALSPGLGLY